MQKIDKKISHDKLLDRNSEVNKTKSAKTTNIASKHHQ